MRSVVMAKKVSAAVCVLILLFLAGCAPHGDTPQSGAVLHCTMSVCCTDLLDNPDLKDSKKAFVPSDGYVLHPTQVTAQKGESVYDLLRRVCAEHVCTDNCPYCQDGGIALESAYTPGYGTYYVEGIHQLYEKDCGEQSGWIFLYNGESATKGCSEIALQDGDVIEWIYTCDWSRMM